MWLPKPAVIALLCVALLTLEYWWSCTPACSTVDTTATRWKVFRQQIVRREKTPVEAAVPLQAVVAHAGNFWWSGAGWQVPFCTWQGQPLSCQYLSAAHAAGNATAEALLRQAGALIHHLCWDSNAVSGQLKQLPQVLFTLESEANYPCINTQPADIEMSYRQCAQVWSPYILFSDRPVNVAETLQQPAVPWDEKQHAIIYVNSNCHTSSNRHGVITQLQQALQQLNSTLVVHSFGRCGTNVAAALLEDFQRPSETNISKKVQYFSRYKFCVAFENSVAVDYVSEKVYDALKAGCVPIYLGAPNIGDFIPTQASIVHYDNLATPHALAVELERLATNRTAYEERLAWKREGPASWAPGFISKLSYGNPYCELCRLVTSWKLAGQRPNYTRCSDNNTWKSTSQ